jgi:ribosomal protein L11 methyltransferase
VTEPRYPYVAVDVAAGEADEAGVLLFELGAKGIELRDETTLRRGVAGKVTLWAGFERQEEARAALDKLPDAWSPRVEHVVGDAWRDEWKKHFEPFRICDAIVVTPPWRPYDPASGERVVVLEPGRAFGTGLHETTRLVAAILADHAADLRGAALLDVGCGSGILALVALLLGAESARAIDVDPDATAVTRENAERNGLASRVRADVTPVGALADQYRAVVANIEARTLIELAPALAPRVAPGGMLVLSGILAPDFAPGQLDDVRGAYPGLTAEEVRRDGDWVAALFRRQPAG